MGLLVTQWATVTAKKAVGRLRPHFITVCEPLGFSVLIFIILITIVIVFIVLQ